MNILSIGGCATFDMLSGSKAAGALAFDHLWRRPTIALMSPAFRLASDLADCPANLAHYLREDAGKVHLADIRTRHYDVMVVELTRDIWSGVLVSPDGAAIHDPVSGLHLIAGAAWTGDPPACVPNTRLLTYEAADFLARWEGAFQAFVAEIGSRRIIVPELYFATFIEDGTRLDGHFVTVRSEDFGRINRVLMRMYAAARRLGVTLVETRGPIRAGLRTPRGGPFPTHYAQDYAETMRLRLQDACHLRTRPPRAAASTSHHHRRAA